MFWKTINGQCWFLLYRTTSAYFVTPLGIRAQQHHEHRSFHTKRRGRCSATLINIINPFECNRFTESAKALLISSYRSSFHPNPILMLIQDKNEYLGYLGYYINHTIWQPPIWQPSNLPLSNLTDWCYLADIFTYVKWRYLQPHPEKFNPTLQWQLQPESKKFATPCGM